MDEKKITFEEALKQLECISLRLEDGNMSLDESITSFETGMKLIEFCRGCLDQAEAKFRILDETTEKDKEP